MDDSNHVYYSNRSAAHLSSGDNEAALQDGEMISRKGGVGFSILIKHADVRKDAAQR